MLVFDDTQCRACGVVFKNSGLLALHKKRSGGMCYLCVAPNEVAHVEVVPESPQSSPNRTGDNASKQQFFDNKQHDCTDAEHDDEYQEKIRFQTMVQLLNDNNGASESDIAHIIHYIKHLVDSGKRPPFDNVSQLKAFREQLLEDMGGGWTKSFIVVDQSDIPTLAFDFKFETEFHHMNMMLWLDSQFGNMDYQNNFVLRAAKKYNSQGERYVATTV